MLRQLQRWLTLHHVHRPGGRRDIRCAVLEQAQIVLQIGVVLAHLIDQLLDIEHLPLLGRVQVRYQRVLVRELLRAYQLRQVGQLLHVRGVQRRLWQSLLLVLPLDLLAAALACQGMHLLHLLLSCSADKCAALAEQRLQLWLGCCGLADHGAFPSCDVDLSDQGSLWIETVRLLLEEVALRRHLRLLFAQCLQRRVAVRLFRSDRRSVEGDAVHEAVSEWPLADQVQLALAVQ